MKYLFSAAIILVLSMAIFFFSLSYETPARASGGGIPGNFIFAQDTPDDYVEEVYGNLTGELGANFFTTTHWDPAFTATGDGGANQGDSLTLTWSIIPDGTSMSRQFFDDTGCSSSLIANLDAIYGAGNWQNEIANVFDDWASKTGNIYVQVTDDGAPWPTSPGILGLRGDIRIGGCTVDGNGGILAFNVFPDSGGDMKIDSTDSWYTTASLTTAFHNVISHEHGHGVGVLHVCPVNQTKLMEPFVTTAFKGLQHDDIRAIQRHYGDRNELIGGDNDISSRATDLGTLTNDVAINVQGLSIDDNEDTDWFGFNAGVGAKVDVTLTPIGFTYPNGPQNSNGSCTSGKPDTNSLTIHNLGFEIIDSNGTTVLATGNASPAGVAEVLNTISLGAAGTKYIRVFGDTTDGIQLYDLQVMTRGPVLTASIDADPDPILATAAMITYTLTIQNIGGSPATNVVITNTIPASTTLNTVSDGGIESPPGMIVWPAVPEININSSITRTFRVTVTNVITNGDQLVNVVSASSGEGATIQNQVITEFVGMKTIYLPIVIKN